MKFLKKTWIWLTVCIAAGVWVVTQRAPNHSQSQNVQMGNGTGAFKLNLNQGTASQKFKLPESIDMMIQISPAHNIIVILKEPNGQVIKQKQAASLGYVWKSLSYADDLGGLISPEPSLYITKPSPLQGEYEITVSPLDGAPSNVAVHVFPIGNELYSKAMVGVPGDNRLIYTQGQDLLLSYLLYTSNGPVPQAQVIAEVRGPQSVQSIPLQDNGIYPDQQASDGLYSGLVRPTEIGHHTATFTANGQNAGRGSFQGRQVQGFTVDRPDLQLTGSYQDQGVDLNGDGLYDAVQITFGASGPFASSLYGLSATLKLPSGKYLTAGTQFSSGEAATLLFPVQPDDPTEPLDTEDPSSLKELGFGEYEITNVILDTETTVEGSDPLPRLLSQFASVGKTQNYEATQMQRDPTQVKGWNSDEGIDWNGNGKYDQLNVALEVEVMYGGSYGVSADLVAPDDTVIATFGQPSTDLNSGSTIVTLAFPGDQVGATAKDGPYRLKNITIYPNFYTPTPAVATVEVLGQSAKYLANAFDGYLPPVTATVKAIGEGLTSGGRVKVNPNSKLTLLNGSRITEGAVVQAPDIGKLIPKLSCAKVISGNQQWSSQVTMDQAFGPSDCLQVKGNVHLNFKAVLKNKTLLLESAAALHANQGLQVENSTVVTGGLHVNKEFAVVNSKLFSRDTKGTLNLNGPTDFRGVSSLVAAGRLSISGFLGTDHNEHADVMLITGDDLTVTSNSSMNALIWSGGRTFLNGLLDLKGAVLSRGDIQLNRNTEVTLQKLSKNTLSL